MFIATPLDARVALLSSEGKGGMDFSSSSADSEALRDMQTSSSFAFSGLFARQDSNSSAHFAHSDSLFFRASAKNSYVSSLT